MTVAKQIEPVAGATYRPLVTLEPTWRSRDQFVANLMTDDSDWVTDQFVMVRKEAIRRDIRSKALERILATPSTVAARLDDRFLHRYFSRLQLVSLVAPLPLYLVNPVTKAKIAFLMDDSDRLACAVSANGLKWVRGLLHWGAAYTLTLWLEPNKRGLVIGFPNSPNVTVTRVEDMDAFVGYTDMGVPLTDVPRLFPTPFMEKPCWGQAW